jgi:acyl carrier protein
MVPQRVVWVAEMPLTRHGKVDRRQLALLGEAAAAGEVEEYEAAQGAVEELVAGIFAAVLQREQVSRRGNFFALGGHSLLATQVMSRVRSVFGVEVPLRSLFEHPTVASLSQVIEEKLLEEVEAMPEEEAEQLLS